MAFLLAQAGTTLNKVDLSSGTVTALTLPTDVTLSSSRKPKFATLNQWTVMVNTPTKNLAIDPEGVVKVLVPQGPTTPATIAAGATGALTGAYRVAFSFIVKNSDGELLMESPIGPVSAQLAAITAKDLAVTNVPISVDDITGRRYYRTLAGGDADTLFHIGDIDDNTTLAFNDNVADSLVGLLPAFSETLVSPPGTLPGIRFKNIVEWKSRLWAVADEPSLVDTVYYTETNKVYAWPNSLVAHPTGQDTEGVVAFAPRRNQLGLLKRKGVWAIGGASSATGIASTNISVNQIAGEDMGCVAPDSVVAVGDVVFWLTASGVARWDDSGVKIVSDEKVFAWFSSDTYFNRSRFPNAFARYNKIRDQYELHLANAGDSTENRWVSLNMRLNRWFGPHKTGALTPTSAGHLLDSNGLPMTLVGGSDGVIYSGNSSNKRDGAATAIDMDCHGKFHYGNDPDFIHVWLQPTILSKIESAGTMTITPHVGELSASAGTALTHTLTTGREKLARLGPGRLAQLRFRKNTVNQSATIYGYILPWLTRGRR